MTYITNNPCVTKGQWIKASVTPLMFWLRRLKSLVRNFNVMKHDIILSIIYFASVKVTPFVNRILKTKIVIYTDPMIAISIWIGSTFQRFIIRTCRIIIQNLSYCIWIKGNLIQGCGGHSGQALTMSYKECALLALCVENPLFKSFLVHGISRCTPGITPCLVAMKRYLIFIFYQIP